MLAELGVVEQRYRAVRHPQEILTDNGKVFTGRFGTGPGPVMFDRICADNGIRHLLTAPYSPTTTGKVERLHKTMRAEFFTPADGTWARELGAFANPKGRPRRKNSAIGNAG